MTTNLYFDEAGRWPLAWPVCTCVVFISHYTNQIQSLLRTVKDSKTLSPKNRQLLYSQITKSDNLHFACTFWHAHSIDKFWIIPMIKTWIQTNIAKLQLHKNQRILLILDWNSRFGLKKNRYRCYQPIVKGDKIIPEISAASIIAKVTRDKYMIKKDKEYPAYCFKTNKWYWTKNHRKAIHQFWLTPLHRKSFCSFIQQ
mgnify:CR=1 FL=1